MVYSPFATQEAPKEVKEQKRNEEERRQKVNLRLSAVEHALLLSAQLLTY